MPTDFTWDAAPAATSSPSGGKSFTWENPPASDVLSKMAQPTQFEKDRANESATPWKDLATGVGRGALKTVSDVGTAIHAIPGVGEKIIPSAGLTAEKNIATPRNVGEQTGSNMENAAEMLVPFGEGIEAAKGSKLVRPAARFAEENILPAIKSIPYVGKGIEAAEKAPTLAKAAVRGGTTGAAVGGIEQGVRTRNPMEALKGAAEGGTIGALTGMGAYGVRKLAMPSMVSETPMELPAAKADVPRGTMPTFEATEFPGGSRQISMQSGGQQQGHVMYSLDPQGRASVDSSLISGEFEGKGHGTKMYEQAIEDARKAGAKEFTSGSHPEPGAQRVWESLGKKYPVEKSGDGYRIDLQPIGESSVSSKAPIARMGDLIERGAGTQPLEPNVPLRSQPRSVGAASTFDLPPSMATPPRAGVIPKVPLGSSVATPISEEFGPMAKRTEGIPRMVTEEPLRQMGAPPLRPNVSLREQPTTAETPIRSEQARLEEKYPDKAARQMVHANGEEMVDAIGNDKNTMKAIHDLTNPDVRQAMINSGEDMGQKMINNRKASGDISRQQAFKKLLSKGHSPQDIVKLAKS